MMKKLIRFRNIGVCICIVFLLIFLVKYAIVLFLNRNKDDSALHLDIDNFSIEELTDEQIISVYGSYESRNSYRSCTGATSGLKGVKYDEADHSRAVWGYGEITGINTISATRAENCTLKLDVEINVKEGNVKLVVVKDDAILEYLEPKNQTLTYEVEGTHIFLIKILCEEAKLNVSVYRSFE